MNGKKKLLYIMGIDWNWIFQRPQIIEQYLEELYDVTVIFPRSILKAFRKSQAQYPKDYRILWTLPLQEKCRFIGCLSSLYSRQLFKNIKKYDLIVIGYPLYFRYVPDNYAGKVIYDCMDNHEALFQDKKNIGKIVGWEKALVRKSNVVIVTSDKLFHKVKEISPNTQTFLIRNGTASCEISKPAAPQRKNRYKVGYFGTVAEWFDFDLLNKSLAEYSDIEYHLIGPVCSGQEHKSQRIIFEGVVEHQNLQSVTKDYSCFVMPFIVNDIVEWVDPVKLYEYIAMGKCIIAVRYPEISRFEDYIYMYSDEKEFLNILQKLRNEGFPPKYTSKQQEDFLKENSWNKRFEVLDRVLLETMQK